MTTLKRRRDWVDRFEEAVRERAGMAFSWGTHDCVMAAVHCIKAITDEDVATRLRGYKTLRGARYRLAKYGGIQGLAESVAERYGAEEVKPMFAQRGDCVVVQGDVVDPETGTDEVLGVVDLSGHRVLVADEKGWQTFPLTSVVRAWRIG